MSEEYDITPDVSLMWKMGQSGYRLWQAISEFIDNSIDAKIKEEKLIIEIEFDLDEGNWVKIRDYGKGMDLKTFRNSVVLARVIEPSEEKLGKFGLGLKSACTSIGKNFRIETKYYLNKKEEVYVTEYIEDKFLKKNKWELDYTVKIDPKFKQGTEIYVWDLKGRDTLIYENKIQTLINNLQYQYSTSIRDKKVSIRMKNYKEFAPRLLAKKIEQAKKLGWDGKEDEIPPYSWKLDERYAKKTQGKIELKPLIKFSTNSKEYTVKGWFGILPIHKGSAAKGLYGFNLIWHGRIIKAYEKIGFYAHPENARVVGELYLDDFPVTINKQDFMWEQEPMIKLTGADDYRKSVLYPVLKPYLEQFVEEKEKIRQIKKELEDKIEDDKLRRKIVKQIEESTSDRQAKAIISKYLGKRKQKELEKLMKEEKKLKKRKEMVQEFAFKYDSKIKGKIELKEEFLDNIKLKYDYKKVGDKIKIIVNPNYPSFVKIKDREQYFNNILIRILAREVCKEKFYTDIGRFLEEEGQIEFDFDKIIKKIE